MRLNSLSLRNMRLFGDPAKEIVFDGSKNITIFLGDNGSGKTTIMDAIIHMLSPFMGEFPGSSTTQFTDSDIHKEDGVRTADYLSVKAEVLTEDGEAVKVVRSRKGSSVPKETTDLQGLKKYAASIMERVQADKLVEFPLIAYYGTGRGFIQMPERRRNFADVFERWDAYIGAPQPNTDFKRFVNWFDLQEDDERREKIERNDTSYQSPSLNVVRDALARFIGNRCSNPRILNRPLRFVVDEMQDDGTVREMRLEEMSDGYKIVIAMVADIASRMIEANPVTPQQPNPLNASGIILIDEVDLHLHPKWQREILKQLKDTFPNIQFVVTTHSPVIVVGAADIAQVVNLNAGGAIQQKAFGNIALSNVGQVLLSDLFGLYSLQTPQWDEKIKERDSILQKEKLTDADKKRLAELDKEMSGMTTLQDSNAIRSAMLLEKIAKQLNVKL